MTSKSAMGTKKIPYNPRSPSLSLLSILLQCSISSGTSVGSSLSTLSSAKSASTSSSANPAPFAAPPKQQGSLSRPGSRRSARSASSYDEMSINSGRPVIVSKGRKY